MRSTCLDINNLSDILIFYSSLSKKGKCCSQEEGVNYILRFDHLPEEIYTFS